MALNQTQKQKLTDWLNSKGVKPQCVACGSKNWDSGDIVSAPVMSSGGGMQIGGPNVPMVQVICMNCGHIMLFAAVPIGLA